MSWFRLFPLLLLPALILGALGLLPDFRDYGLTFGGPVVRMSVINTLVLSWLPDTLGWQLVSWYEQAGSASRYVLHALIALNVNVLCLPVLYGLGQGYIRLSNWSTRASFEHERRGIKST